MGKVKSKNINVYDKLAQILDSILDSKRISYTSFAFKLGMQSISFYHRYKLYGFTVEDIKSFIDLAKTLKANTIKCIKCEKEFTPKTKNVKRAICKDCKIKISKEENDKQSLKYNYPLWVKSIKNIEIRKLVEQEFHIEEKTAYQMAKSKTIFEAKAIRKKRWDTNRY